MEMFERELKKELLKMPTAEDDMLNLDMELTVGA